MQEAMKAEEIAEFKARVYHSLDEAELIKSGKKKAHPIYTLWNEL